MPGVARAVSLLVLGLAAASACRREPIAVGPVPDTVLVSEDSAAIRDSLARAQQAAEDERRRAEEDAAAAGNERRMAEAQAALTAPIYYDLDQSDPSDDGLITLDAKVPVLAANPGLRLRISGHADSRGSDEYNLALAQRRAASVKLYLEQRGIDGGRLDVVSYGEERPAVEGEGEGAWAQNRRAEFEIVAGELTTAPGGAE